MLDFLNEPEEISQSGFNYRLSAEEIKELMFGLTAAEIVDKVFATNAMDFLKLNFNR